MSRMDKENETDAAIAEEMRKETLGEDGVFYSMDGRRVMVYADRIEAAGKNTVPASLAVSTVRALLEGRTKEEKDNAVLELSRHFDRNGKWQLGCYVRAMAQLEPTWVPMDEGFGGKEG